MLFPRELRPREKKERRYGFSPFSNASPCHPSEAAGSLKREKLACIIGVYRCD
jgi:hypothetical protein